MSAVLAPGGWGWRPGVPLVPADGLPDLPLLSMLRGFERNAVLVETLRPLPNLHSIRVRDLVAKYEIPQVTASLVLARAKS